jgi:hypothetical protein
MNPAYFRRSTVPQKLLPIPSFWNSPLQKHRELYLIFPGMTAGTDDGTLLKDLFQIRAWLPIASVHCKTAFPSLGKKK